MADRNTKVTLSLQVDQYLSGMEKAAKATREAGSEAEKLAQKKEAFNALGLGALAFGAAVGAGVALAVKKFAEFDQAMSFVQAATHETAENMGLLRDAALEAGASTVFSATEAANAIEELAKAGLSTADILGGALDGALDLAAAGGLDVADAAGIAATALKTFGLQGKDVGHVSDLLAAGAGKAMGSVEDLSQALNQGGLVAKSTGLSIDETTAALSAFAAKGLLGSDAGTSFKAMLQRLTPQSAEAQAKMDELGISAYDAGGNFVGLANFAGNLRESLRKLTPEQRNSALATIFGSDAVRAANVLYEEGAEGIKDWTDKVDDSGYAAETARIRLDNLSGDLEQLGGAFDTALIKSGSAANDSLRGLTQSATNLVSAFAGAPEGVQGVVLAIGAVTAAVALGGGAFLLAIPKIAAYKVALATLTAESRVAAIAVKGVGLGLGALAIAAIPATIIISQFADQQAKAQQAAEDFANSLDQSTGSITENTRALAAKKLQDSGALDLAKKLGVSLDDVTDASLGNAEAYKRVNEKLDEYQGKGSIAANIVDKLRVEIDGNNEALDAGKESLSNQTAATEANTESTKSAAEAYTDASDAASGLNDQVLELIDTVNEANGVGQDAVSANLDYQDALGDVDEQLKNIKDKTEGYASGLNEATAAGRANETLLVDLAAKSQEAAKAQFDLDGNTEKYKTTLEAGRQAVIDRATALGATADEAQTLADKIYAIPSEKQFTMIANTAEALRRLQELQATKDAFVASGLNITAYVRQAKAEGGAISGPGTGTSDSIPAMLSNGEHVLTAADVRAAGGQGAIYAWRQSLHGGAARFASGGQVSSAPVSSSVDSRSYPVTVQVVPQQGRSMAEQYQEVQRVIRAQRRG